MVESRGVVIKVNEVEESVGYTVRVDRALDPKEVFAIVEDMAGSVEELDKEEAA